MVKRIVHDKLGEITLSQSRRSKRITLTVRPPGEVRLSFPVGVSQKRALKFAESRADWVNQQVEKYKKRYNTTLKEPFVTRHHTLEFTPADSPEVKFKIEGGVVEVTYPQQMRYVDPEVQEVAKRGVEEAWRAEAKAILPIRLSSLAQKHGFRYGRVTIRNNISRWGSCSAQDNISLSLHLMRMPDHLVDYVLLHELCHTVHKNHGSKFHALLDRVTSGRHGDLRREMRRYSARW